MKKSVLKRYAAAAVLFMIMALGIAHGREATPRFMVMIDEKNLGAYTTSEAENVVTEYLLTHDLDVVDAELVKTVIDRDKALQSISTGLKSAASLGLQFGAEVLIVGKAVAKGSADHIRETSFRSYQAQVSLKAIRTDTAEVLASVSASAAKIHVDDVVGGGEAIRSATSPVVETLISKVMAAMSGTEFGKARKIQLVIGNVRQVWQVSAVKDLLRKETAGVKEVIQRSFVSGTAVFDILYGSDSHQLAEDLTLQQPEYFSLRVVGITPNKLDMKLVEADP